MTDNSSSLPTNFGSSRVPSTQQDLPLTDSKFALAFLFGNCTSEGNLEQSSVSGYENDIRQGIDMLQASSVIPEVVSYVGGSQLLKPENGEETTVPVSESQESGYSSNAGSQPIGEDFFDIDEMASLESEDELTDVMSQGM